MDDLHWPTHCPILGIPLLWESPYDRAVEESPSFMRLDHTKGYIPGNVVITSLRANRLKGDGSAEEHEKIAKYIEATIG